MHLARYVDGDGSVWAGVVGPDDQLTPFARGDASAAGAQSELIEAAMSRRAPEAIGPPVARPSVRLLAPIGVPPSIRDFYAFEDHVATARRARGLEVDPDWYELPIFY
ncbi:MAG: fumarylacetoacetate hydrolase family protein, partial [Acidimicrobiia bacterium]|nr:fumarylacetoacetate hydrolase family protein [Acidimicrobiia bacterium]